jgi:hypothetical protein
MTPLVYEKLTSFREGRPEYRLLEAFSYELGGFGSEHAISVPHGFITDFASIPFGLRWLLPPNGRWAKAAVVHDFMYEFSVEFGYRREFCDLIFHDGMKLLGVPIAKRLTMYFSVRLFGKRNFGKKAFEIYSKSVGAQA